MTFGPRVIVQFTVCYVDSEGRVDIVNLLPTEQAFDSEIFNNSQSMPSVFLPEGFADEQRRTTDSLDRSSIPYGLIASILVGSIMATLAWRLYAKRKDKK